MTRGKTWTDSEIKVISEMLQSGATLDEIVKSGRLEGRTSRAIEKQIRLMRVSPKKSKVTLISKADILSLDEFVARYVDAFIKLCETEELAREDLERFRIIFMAAWKYRELFREYEELEEVKIRLERLEAMVAQLATEKKTEAP